MRDFLTAFTSPRNAIFGSAMAYAFIQILGDHQGQAFWTAHLHRQLENLLACCFRVRAVREQQLHARGIARIGSFNQR